jgi:hypothetical protein
VLRLVAFGLNEVAVAVGDDQVELGALVLVPTRLIESFEQIVLLGPAFITGVGVIFTLSVPATGVHPVLEAVKVSVTLVGAAVFSAGAGLYVVAGKVASVKELPAAPPVQSVVTPVGLFTTAEILAAALLAQTVASVPIVIEGGVLNVIVLVADTAGQAPPVVVKVSTKLGKAASAAVAVY